MDTTKKGDKLEDQAFDVFESQIAEDCFFSRREFCKIFRKKGYYSKDREKNIIFDLSIEVTLPGQDRFSLLFLIECKNYGHSVPVNETYTVSSNQFFSSLARRDAEPDFLKALANIEQATTESRLCVPYLERQAVEERSLEVLSAIKYESGAVPLNTICELLEEQFGLVVKRNSRLGDGILGQISFGPDMISIDDDQASTTDRARFTLAHELGHFALEHRRFMVSETCHEEDIDIENSDIINLKDIHRMEWQANYFASCLLLPKEQFERAFFLQAQMHELTDRGYGLLYLDNQRFNIDTFYRVTAPLMNTFQVSRTVIKLRLIKLGLLNEAQDMPNNAFQPMRSLSRPLG